MSDFLFIGVFKNDNGEIGFDVSRYDNKEEAKTYLDESGLEILDILQVRIHPQISDCPGAVIRALDTSPDGVQVLTLLLGKVAEYYQEHHKEETCSFTWGNGFRCELKSGHKEDHQAKYNDTHSGPDYVYHPNEPAQVVGKFGPMGNMQGKDHPFRR